MADEQRPKDSDGSPRQGWALVDAAWQIVGAVAVCGAAGYFADAHFGTKPRWFVVGAIFGIVAGMTLFFKTVLSIGSGTQKRKN